MSAAELDGDASDQAKGAERALAQRRLEQTERRIAEDAHAMGESDPKEVARHAIALAAHAALPAACDAELLHLLRINFFFDREALPYWVEPRLLLAPLWSDDGRGLYLMPPELRSQLLRRLAAHYGRERMVAVATLLWRTTERRRDWADRSALRHAQQLTALNFLAPERAAAWLAQAQAGTHGDTLHEAWFVAMRQELPALPQANKTLGQAPDWCDRLMRLFPTGARQFMATGGPGHATVLSGPPGHAQRWRLYRMLHARPSPPPLLLEFEADPDPGSGRAVPMFPGNDRPLHIAPGEFLPEAWRNELAPGSVAAIHRAERFRPVHIMEWAKALRGIEVVFVFEREIADGWANKLNEALREIKVDMQALPDWPVFAIGDITSWVRANLAGTAFMEAFAETDAQRLELDARIVGDTGGIPERVFESLCAAVGMRWPDVLELARAPFDAPAPSTGVHRLTDLAHEYDELREHQGASSRRTAAMTAITSRMREVAESIIGEQLQLFADSASAGMRLVAVVLLQLRPSASWCEWLASRVIEEKPFISYQALRALQLAVETLDNRAASALADAMAIVPRATGLFVTDPPRKVLYERLKRAWHERQQRSMTPVVSEMSVFPGASRRVSIEQATALKRAIGGSRFVVGVASQGGIATLAELSHEGEDMPRLFGLQRVRIVHLEKAGSGSFQATTEPAPDDPPPDPIEAAWVHLQSACDALRRIEPGLPGLLELDELGRIEPLYECLSTLPPDDPRDHEIISAQDRDTKLILAFDRLVAEVQRRLRKPSAGTRTTTIARLLRRRYPVPLAGSGIVHTHVESRLASHLARLESAPDVETVAQALALRPDDDELWSACGPWLPLRTPQPIPLKLWPNGSTLRLRFIGGDAFRRRRVLEHSKKWFEHANLNLVVLPDRSRTKPAELRVAFEPNTGTWAYVGTDAMAVSQNEPTMNLGWIGPDIDEATARGLILKHFGHALGLIQEHQNPNARIPWDLAGMKRNMEGLPMQWDARQIREFIRLMPRFDYRQFDVESVMLWPIRSEWVATKQGFGGATDLSKSDIELIEKLYPRQAG